jgi:hypothetical protein
MLQRSPALASLAGEGHLLSEIFHPSVPVVDEGHELGANDVRSREAQVLHWLVHHLTHGGRYLDKTPRNSLRVPYLQALYPKAVFVFVVRDGRAAVSSLMTGWESGGDLFPGLDVGVPLAIDGYLGTEWKFVLPGGWRNYATGRTLAEVCAFQWRACTEALLDARGRSDPDRWVLTRYEDLVGKPEQEARRLLADLRLPEADDVLAHARRLDEHVTKTITPPQPDKWLIEHPDAVEAVLPMIRPTMERLGYARDGLSPGVG